MNELREQPQTLEDTQDMMETWLMQDLLYEAMVD